MRLRVMTAEAAQSVAEGGALPDVAVVILHGGCVFLVAPGISSYSQNGVLGLPGGPRDGREDAAGAAIRECFKETGLLVEERDLVELEEHYVVTLRSCDGRPERVVLTVFVTDKYRGVERYSDETIPCWVSTDTLGGLVLQEHVVDVVSAAQAALTAD